MMKEEWRWWRKNYEKKKTGEIVLNKNEIKILRLAEKQSMTHTNAELSEKFQISKDYVRIIMRNLRNLGFINQNQIIVAQGSCRSVKITKKGKTYLISHCDSEE